VSRPEPAPVDQQKRVAAEFAAQFVESGMIVGLGTGSTVAHLLPALAARRLDISCVATSAATARQAEALGLVVMPFDAVDRFDVAIDGADQISPEGWLVKGGGAAHTREKIVAAAADRFIVIADAGKTVATITAPIPVELMRYGMAATLRQLMPIRLRDVPESPDGGVIADFLGAVDDPRELAAWLAATPGVVDHGLFGPELVSDIIVASASGVDHRTLPRERETR
jgi:ribose 5-phosphate isomerase A